LGKPETKADADRRKKLNTAIEAFVNAGIYSAATLQAR
jgi:hypothetical protein